MAWFTIQLNNSRAEANLQNRPTLFCATRHPVVINKVSSAFSFYPIWPPNCNHSQNQTVLSDIIFKQQLSEKNKNKNGTLPGLLPNSTTSNLICSPRMEACSELLPFSFLIELLFIYLFSHIHSQAITILNNWVNWIYVYKFV